MARDGGLGHVRAWVARPGAAWSAREIESQALATLAALAQISTPSAAHFLKSHQLLVQKFAADQDRQKGLEPLTEGPQGPLIEPRRPRSRCPVAAARSIWR